MIQRKRCAKAPPDDGSDRPQQRGQSKGRQADEEERPQPATVPVPRRPVEYHEGGNAIDAEANGFAVHDLGRKTFVTILVAPHERRNFYPAPRLTVESQERQDQAVLLVDTNLDPLEQSEWGQKAGLGAARIDPVACQHRRMRSGLLCADFGQVRLPEARLCWKIAVGEVLT